MRIFNFKAVVLVLGMTAFASVNVNAATSVYTYNQPNVTVSDSASSVSQQRSESYSGLRRLDDKALIASHYGFDRHKFGEFGRGHSWGSSKGSVVAPVPEAETYSMMLAGLALMCLIAYRRRLDSH
jgi:hypothetical protein